MLEFLQTRLPFYLLESAFVFGSVAKNHPNPKDCDLVIVLNCNPIEIKWRTTITFLEEVKSEFFKKFGIPLNILIYTIDEMNEQTALQKRIFSRMIIRLK